MGTVVHALGSAMVLAAGVMLLAVGSLALGGVATVGGASWLVWCLRRA
ncbi:hypothetical protein GCM10023215_38530 [Pseudonocardia yuanmonensis]|uniref:Uncharacterized protein n=1 Tax=Pseudonocardia yuanmonensis TaxID=1095914 RepID=A0ABP8WYD6_9PSEU